MKRKNNSVKRFITASIGILAIVVVGLAVWKFRYLMDFKNTNVEMFKNMEKPDQKSAYMIYTVDIHKAGKTYYVKFKDVVCDAANDIDDTKHYFRLDITFETHIKENANLLKANEKAIIESLRKTVANLRVTESNSKKVMDYIKDNARRNAETIIGKGNITGVYFEGFLSQ